jgi:alkylation response protein AidB-like acyl-CoA dehydrogenase
MRFSFTDEQQEFRRVVRRFCEERSPASEVRRLMESERGYDPSTWRQLCDELGLAGLHVPEAYGGQGFGFAELAIALEETGRALLCAPYLSSVALAATAILEAASEAEKQELLPGIAAGTTLATLAFAEPAGEWTASGVSLTARAASGEFRLDGTKSFVLDGCAADLIVVVAREPGSAGSEGLGLFSVAGDAPGLERRSLATLDATRRLARLDFQSVIARPLGEPGQLAPVLARVKGLAAIALANEMVGGAEQALDSAVAYAKTRMQFGRPIGSFQAIKHKCVEMLLEVELAKSAAYYAAAAADEGDPELGALAAIAKSLASDAFRNAATENIQIHGGVGFTWEDDAHLYFRRAKSSEVFFGDAGFWRQRLADELGVGRDE